MKNLILVGLGPHAKGVRWTPLSIHENGQTKIHFPFFSN
jgi:hypothetical protein